MNLRQGSPNQCLAQILGVGSAGGETVAFLYLFIAPWWWLCCWGQDQLACGWHWDEGQCAWCVVWAVVLLLPWGSLAPGILVLLGV